MTLRERIRRRIVQASPHCRLWVQDHHRDVKYFRLWPSWIITAQEYEGTRHDWEKGTNDEMYD